MFQQTFYHSLIKKYTVLFGTLFNNIAINRSDGTNDDAQTLKVPLSYGPKEKMLAAIKNDPNLLEEKAIQLPRMSFEMTQLTYAFNRKLGTTRKVYSVDQIGNKNVNKAVYNPVPYDMYFELNIMAKSLEDGTKILEQILPYFTPEWTVTAKLIDEMPDMSMDIPIILQAVTTEDVYDTSFEQRQVITWTLVFMMKGYFYGPVNDPKVIKISTVNMYADLDANSASETITIIPGLTSNGEPTTNAASTIPYSQINEDDNWGYIVTVETVEDG